MKWILWTGIAFVIGGITSLAITLGATGKLHFLEDVTSYSVGWAIIGAILIAFGYLRRNQNL